MKTQIEHISEEDLERYVAFIETLSEANRLQIQMHLSFCARCSGQLDDIREFYRKLEDRLSQEPLEQDKRLAETIAAPISGKLIPFRGIQEANRGIVDAVFRTVPAKSLILTRSFNYVKRHPAAFSSAVLGVVLILFLLNIENRNVKPVIGNVTPRTLVGRNTMDTVDIIGTGFQEGLNVIIKEIYPDSGTFKKQPLSVNRRSIVLALIVGTDASKWSIQILNPNGKESNIVQFDVVGPKPQRPWLVPKQTTAGGPGLDLIVTGITYNSASIVRWNGQDLPTMPIIAHGDVVMGLKVKIPASYFCVPGSARITVFTPPPGGGLSEPATFQVMRKGSK